MARKVKFAGRTINLPESRILRLAIGTALLLGGLLWFLPILGLWMIPLGLLVLSVDVAIVRRWRRRGEVRLGRWWSARSGTGGKAEAGTDHRAAGEDRG
jgi:hypothetical protein